MASILKRMSDNRGSVFTVLMFGVGMAAAMSVASYQMLLGPVAGAARVNQKAIVESQLASAGRIISMTGAMGPSNGDCDSDGYIELEPYVSTLGPKPTGGGLAPESMGLPTLDPWGTPYGYCVWDVGTVSGGCGSGRLDGADDPVTGNAKTLTVMAIVSAGPDRTFTTTCRNWNNTDDVVISTGTASDDVVRRYTYTEASVAAGGLWQIKAGSADTVKIDKNLEVGNDIDLNQSTGSLQALSVTARGKFVATGGVQLGTDATVTTCSDAMNVGVMRYNNTSNKVEVCTGTTGGWQVAGDSGGGGGGGVMTELVGDAAAGACDSSRDGEIRYVTGESQAWYYCKGAASTWEPFEQPALDIGCKVGELVGSGICIGSINGQDIIAAPKGCSDAAATTANCALSNDQQKTWGTVNTTYGTEISGGADGRAASVAALSNSIGSTLMIPYCDGLRLDGKSWHLPSMAELALMYRAHQSVAMPTAYAFRLDRKYGSARAATNDAANDDVMTLDFATGEVYEGNSTSSWAARCIYRRPAEPRAVCVGPSDCMNIGSRCTSGEVFAGCHPLTRKFMFFQACARGKTWDGSTCTGGVTNTTWGPDTSATNLRATGVTDIFDGEANTTALTNGVVDGTGDAKTTAGLQQHNAAQYCADLSEGGHTDWYLPAYAEVMPIFMSANFNFMSPEDYTWLSTEALAAQAYVLTRLSGTQYKIYGDVKSSQRPVFCMRTEPGSFNVQACTNNSTDTCILDSLRSASDPDFVTSNIYTGSTSKILGVSAGIPDCTNDLTTECILKAARNSSDTDMITGNIRATKNILNVVGTAVENGTVPPTYNVSNWKVNVKDRTPCLVRPIGQLSCWGRTSFGEVGSGSTSGTIATPVQVHTSSGIPGWYNWIQASGGASHTCGVRNDGTAWCWGSQRDGKLGNGLTTNVSIPRPVQVLDSAGTGFWTDWVKLDVGNWGSCGLRSNGTLWCWGFGFFEDLGNGSTATTAIPVQVHTDTGPGSWSDWIDFSKGYNATCGIRSDQSVWCWDNGTGDGTTTDRPRPTRVKTDAGGAGWNDWVKISTGYWRSCGIRSNGTAWCWGGGSSGETGDGTTNPALLPVQVKNSDGSGHWADWTDIAVGFSPSATTTCGVRSNGTAWCWGSNSGGQFGVGNTNDSILPVQVKSDTGGYWSDWVSITVGLDSYGIRRNGTVWNFGLSTAGTGYLPVPVRGM